ncbi:hypothetical protein CRP7_gp36 [Roseobacter phage CRP-7]|nr:hypothetical protein CRP7_gp36 [Roseobacter phage CRP-7]
MSFLARNPMDPTQQQQPQGRQIQGGPTVQKKEGMGSKLANLAVTNTATQAMTPGGLLGSAAKGTQGLLGAEGAFAPASGAIGSAITSGLGAAQGALATGAASALPGASTLAAGIGAAAPALAAAGPFALMALPFLLNEGTNNVPEINYGPDPLAQGYNDGTGFAKKYMDATPMGQAAQGNIPGGLIPQMIAGGGSPMDMLKQVSPIMALGGALGLKDGTSCAGMNCNCASCKARKYNYGTAGVKPTTNMAYAGGTDSVPAMLTPGEAVIPAAAAQNPANKPMINSMVNEGRAANDMAEGMPAEVDMTVMAGPLSGKAKREQMKLLQDMSFKKKAFEAEEQRKQQAFDQKMSQSKMQYMLSMRQSQE